VAAGTEQGEPRWNRAVIALGLLVALAVGVAGCGGGNSTSESTASEESAAAEVPPSKNKSAAGEKPKKGAWGVVFGAEGEALGLILYDLSGHTLYTFSRDKGGASSCYGACAKTWPPALTEGKPRADGEASPAKVGATKRKDGTVQLTYAGHPLYTYADDGSSETNGNDLHSFGGEWYAIRPSGEKP
jgi:predicted lipoprotein with Yx(FWY)xxD motif